MLAQPHPYDPHREGLLMKFSFSYSRWSLWAKCPAAYKYKHIDKIPEEASPAMERGRVVHLEAAAYVEGKTETMPPALERFSILADGLRAVSEDHKLIEQQMAFDRDAKPVQWFGPNAYWRFVWDAAVTNPAKTEVDAVDWKTGRPYGSYDDQMQIFSIPAYWTFPKLETFRGHLVYLDTGDTVDFEFNRDQFYGPSGDPAKRDGLYGVWLGNVAMMEADRSFQPKPSRDACRFCAFSAKKGGPCGAGV